MSLQVGRDTNYHAQIEPNIDGFKCDVCTLTFRISSERNIHILGHFQRENCAICSETVIRLGNIWYSIREHPDHNVCRNDIDSIGNGDECELDAIFVDAVKTEPDPVYSGPTESQNEECHPVKRENDNTNYQTEFVRVLDYIEQKPLDIVDELVPITDSQETPSNENDELNIDRHDGVTCELCEKSFANKRNLNTHRRACKGTREEECKRNKSKSDEEPQQVSNFHKVGPYNLDDVEMLEDIVSNEGENATSAMKAKHQCHICKKEIACSTSLKYHMNIHMGIKPYPCSVCGKAFADPRNLLKHSRTHQPPVTITRKQKNKSKSTKQKSAAIGLESGGESGRIPDQVEQEVIDLPAIQTKGQCHICLKKIKCAAALQYHLNVHFKVKPYPCPYCEKTFADKRNRYKHQRIHTEVKTDETAHFYIRGLYDDDNLAGRKSENTDWLCEYCNTEFKYEMTLAKHIQKEHSEQKSEHSCNICVQKFRSLNDLLAHMRAHPESTQYKCTFDGCGQGFAYKAKLSSHLGKHKLIAGQVIRKTQDDLAPAIMQDAANRLSGSSAVDSRAPGEDTVCNICSKKFTLPSTLRLHIQKMHKNERIKCVSEGCDAIFKGKTATMIKHMQQHHPELIRTCETCNKVFYSDAKLAEHQRRHDLFECNICVAKFKHKHRFIQHMSSHEKEAQCDFCNKKFSSVKGMMIHRKNHEQKKIITCRFPSCTSTFETHREFRLHTSQHPTTSRNRSVCPYCGKAVSKSFLRDHMNIHTGARPHECSICNEKFSLKGSLVRHALIHTNLKPYVCDIDGCTQAYRDSTDLKRHKFSVHKIYTKKHICSICSKVFSEPKLLRYHIVKAHDKVEPESAKQTDQNTLN